MSHRFDDEDEEDELQRILEGRDVQDEQDYDSVNEDNDSANEDNETHLNYEYSYEFSKTVKHRSEVKNIRSRQPTDRSKTLTKQNNSSNNRVSNSREQNHFDLDQSDHDQQIDGDSEEKTDQNDSQVKVKVRRIVSRPQPKLNADKLMTKTGVAHLPKLFEDVKFGGKGHELSDLNKIMFKLEHWSHRLFPSLTFDDFIEKVEQLGNKRPLKTFVSKIRYDLPLNLDPEEEVADLHSDDEQNMEENNTIIDPVAAFDAIVGKHSEDINNLTNDSQRTPDSQRDTNDEQVATEIPNGHEETDFQMGSNEETNDCMSEDEVIRQLNSNDVEMD